MIQYQSDDASHINWHQIKTLDIMLSKVAEGGFYVVEDIGEMTVLVKPLVVYDLW